MSREGVYATYFVFARVKNPLKITLESEVDLEQSQDFLEEIFG
jgi:hypothetical protein